ncbi:hypothetical protein [Enterococcus sp. AZ109]|uniref:hypothetical protein n=1 Tax=Enterococcus sp. AZ109 TaxID=2774634 RepID=UPI003F1F4EC3
MSNSKSTKEIIFIPDVSLIFSDVPLNDNSLKLCNRTFLVEDTIDDRYYFAAPLV